jgi:hypothetical protein
MSIVVMWMVWSGNSPTLLERIPFRLYMTLKPLQISNVILSRPTLSLTIPFLRSYLYWILTKNLLGDLKYIGFVCFGLVVVSVVVCVGWTIKNHSAVVIRTAQPFFLIMVATGVLIMSSTLVPLSFDDGGTLEPESHTWSVGVYMSVPWLAFTGFTVTFSFSVLFSKTWRVNGLFKAKAGHTRIKGTLHKHDEARHGNDS